MQLLKCPVQNYAWGKLGRSSEVARCVEQVLEGGVSEDVPYAELWMGTHPNGPAEVILNPEAVSLNKSDKGSEEGKEALRTQPLLEFLGGRSLPYLLKVLSVRTALSVQAHPDKNLAAQLHRDHPEIYKDPNHKPEMTIALTEFHAMCGFRPVSQLIFFLRNVPEFAALCLDNESSSSSSSSSASSASSQELSHEQKQQVESLCLELLSDDELSSKAALRRLFTSVMTSSPARYQTRLQALLLRLSLEKDQEDQKNQKNRLSFPEQDSDDLNVKQLLLRLQEQYPGDVGLFAVFLLNCRRLWPGQAVFLAANEPHAYLAGDCVEAMAQSDNVVRAGLTPKLRHTDVLCEMLSYRTGRPQLLQSLALNPYTQLYSAGAQAPEFKVFASLLPGAASCVVPLALRQHQEEEEEEEEAEKKAEKEGKEEENSQGDKEQAKEKEKKDGEGEGKEGEEKGFPLVALVLRGSGRFSLLQSKSKKQKQEEEDVLEEEEELEEVGKSLNVSQGLVVLLPAGDLSLRLVADPLQELQVFICGANQ